MTLRKLLVALTLTLMGFTPLPSQGHAQQGATIEQRSAQAVWEHHTQAWNTRNLEALVSDYSPNAIVSINSRSYVGRSQIRQAFAGLFFLFDHGKQKIDSLAVKDPVIYISWEFATPHEPVYFGNDSFLVSHGMIAVQTIGSRLYDVHPEIPVSQ